MKVMSASYQKSESQVEEKKSRYIHMYSYIEEDATLIWLAVDDVFLLRKYIL